MLRINRDNGIVWTDATANAWKGCAKTSEGCRNCWSEDMMLRFGHTPEPWTIEHIEENLQAYVERPIEAIEPLAKLDQQWVFYPAGSDPGLPWIPEATREAYFESIRENDHLCFQVLTKWAAEDHGADLPTLPDHAMLGVSVESPRRLYRLDWLRERDEAMKFVSFDPLVERIPKDAVDLHGIDWIIVGGESEIDADQRRDMDPEWPIPLYEAAREQDVAFLFKQHSAATAEADRLLDVGHGTLRTFTEFPDLADHLPTTPRAECDECEDPFIHGENGRRDVPREPGLCSPCIAETGVVPGTHEGQATLPGGGG